MNKTTIKQDEHGMYVKAGGYLFRPQPCRGSEGFLTTGESSFQPGQEVKAAHVGGSFLGKVKSEGKQEHWFSHGSYNATPTHQLWNPRTISAREREVVTLMKDEGPIPLQFFGVGRGKRPYTSCLLWFCCFSGCVRLASMLT